MAYLDVPCYTRTDSDYIFGAGVGRSTYSTVPIGSVAYGSVGTSAVHVAGTIYLAEIYINRPMVITNINVLQGATATTDNLIGAIFSSTGALLATSALAGVLQATANTFLVLPLTAVYAIGAGRYFIGIQSNGTTGTTRRVAASTFVDVLTKSSVGVFGTIPAQTVPTTFTADAGPVAYVN